MVLKFWDQLVASAGDREAAYAVLHRLSKMSEFNRTRLIENHRRLP